MKHGQSFDQACLGVGHVLCQTPTQHLTLIIAPNYVIFSNY